MENRVDRYVVVGNVVWVDSYAGSNGIPRNFVGWGGRGFNKLS
jgi:hypothetical protein